MFFQEIAISDEAFFSIEIFISFHCLVAEEPEGEEVDGLNKAEHAETHAQAKDPTNVGEEVDEPIQLSSFPPHEMKILKIDVHHCQIFLHIGIILILLRVNSY